MTSDRPYREAMRPWIAVSELREGAGGQFDPEVVDVLVGALREQRAAPTRLFQHAERVRQAARLAPRQEGLRLRAPARRRRRAA